MKRQRAPAAQTQRMTGAAVWWRSLRAYSFTATLIPVVCAALAAWRVGGHAVSLPACALMLAAALLLHAGVNALNDYYDFILGFDTAAAAGSSGVLAAGLVAPGRLWRWGMSYLAAGAAAGAWLAWLRGPWILALGACGWLGAAFYSHRRGYKYRGWGEPAVFALMGPILFCAAYLAAGGRLEPRALWLSLPFACLVTAIMLVNNLRDLEMDRAAGFRTLPARIGPRAAKGLYGALLAAPPLLTALFALRGHAPRLALLALAAVVPAAALIHRVCRAAPPYASLADAPQQTAALYLLFGMLTACGWAFG